MQKSILALSLVVVLAGCYPVPVQQAATSQDVERAVEQVMDPINERLDQLEGRVDGRLGRETRSFRDPHEDPFAGRRFVGRSEAYLWGDRRDYGVPVLSPRDPWSGRDRFHAGRGRSESYARGRSYHERRIRSSGYHERCINGECRIVDAW